MRALKVLTALAIGATLAWCGYWFAGSRALDQAIAKGLDHVPEVSVADYRILGFPNRFDVTFDQPRIASGGAEWTAPFVQIFALSYRLNHLIAVFAHDQALTLDGTTAGLHSADLRASLVMEPGLDLALDRFTLAGEDLDLQLDGETHGADRLRAASRRIDETVHELVFLAENVFPDGALMARIDPDALWPRRIETIRLDAEAEFDRPLDRHIFDGPEPRMIRLTFTGAQLAWQGVDIALTGRLTPGPTGVLSGDVVLRLTGWRGLLERLGEAGWLTPDYQDLLMSTLAAMAVGAEGNTIEAPLAVVEGDVRLGPLLLGTLPPL